MNSLAKSLVITILLVMLAVGFWGYLIDAEISNDELVLTQDISTLTTRQFSQYQQVAINDGQLSFNLYLYYKNKHTLRAQTWLERAASLGTIDAQLLLIQQSIELGRFEEVEHSLKLLAADNISAADMLITYYVDQGKHELAEQLVVQPSYINISENLHSQLVNYSIISSELSASEFSGDICKNTVQWFASTLEDLQEAENNIVSLLSVAIVADNFCFKPVRYIPKQALACETDAKTTRVSCDDLLLSDIDISSDVKYLALTVNNTKAFVNRGILYVASGQSTNIILHEFMHLLGFVDEYPLPSNHQLCNELKANQFIAAVAPNVVLSATTALLNNANSPQELRQKLLAIIPWAKQIAPSTPLITLHSGQWRLGTPARFNHEVGLFASNTCNDSHTIAWKPISEMTSMEYFDIALTSEYQQLHTDVINEFSMPSYHYNIALAYLDKNLEKQAHNWLNFAVQFEQDERKKTKILTISL